ncbi:hypothetical protein Tco_1251227, partial [Tanacetum coccineum]
MAASGSSNIIARRIVDDLINFSSETAVPNYMSYERSYGGLGCRVKVLDTIGACRGCHGYKRGYVASFGPKE